MRRPLLASASPRSLTKSVSLPPWPSTVSGPATVLTVPRLSGASEDALTVSSPSPVCSIVCDEVPWMSKWVLPAPSRIVRFAMPA